MNKTGSSRRERGRDAAKDHGQESNPGCCGEDHALKVRPVPAEPPGCPRLGFILTGRKQTPPEQHVQQDALRHAPNPRSCHSRLSGDDLTPDGCLDRNLKHLPGYGVFEALTHGLPHAVGPLSADSAPNKIT